MMANLDNTNTLHDKYLYLLALAIPIPIFVKIGGAPIYVFQAAVFFVVSLRILFLKSTYKFTALDKLVFVYVCWSFLSYILNIPWVIFEFGPERVINQSISLVTMLMFLMPYYVGRFCKPSDKNIRNLLQVLSLSSLVVFIYFIVGYVKLMPNLYMARELIGQRIPTVVALISCVLFFMWVISKPRQPLYFIVSSLGYLLVILSLTRAVYIQIAFSFVALVFWMYKNNQIKIRTIIATFTVVAFFAVSGYTFFVQRYDVDPFLLLDRVDQIFHPSETTANDESANVRVTIWADLGKKLIEYPPGLLFGFGQLGPSYIGDKFTSLSGEAISTYSAHNQYLDTLIRSGVIGLLIEVLILINVVSSSFKNYNTLTEEFFIAFGLAIFGVIFYGFFHETLRYHMYSVCFWFYAGFLSSFSSTESFARSS